MWSRLLPCAIGQDTGYRKDCSI